MTKKNRYRATHIEQVSAESVLAQIAGKRLVVGIDVAKERQFAAVMDEACTMQVVVKWKAPSETGAFVELLHELGATRDVEVVMEPTGTYGDALRFQLSKAGLSVFRMEPKRTHDAAELYDGVPSMHDAKAATLIGRLHLNGASTLWREDTETQRNAKARLSQLTLYRQQFQSNRNRVHALLSRYFPELLELLLLRSATLLELLSVYGGPQDIAEHETQARVLMKKVGGGLLTEEKIDAVLRAAKTSVGVPQTEYERQLVCTVAAEARRNQKEMALQERLTRKLTKKTPASRRLSTMVGKVTASVLLAMAGDPTQYKSAQAYRKAFGLNLKEKSSGRQKGGLHLSKRGSSLARVYLFMTALRFIHRSAVVKAWYDKKVQRQGGQMKLKAVVAVMRKLTLAMWHVAQGHAFDAAKLFDTRRLKLSAKAV